MPVVLAQETDPKTIRIGSNKSYFGNGCFYGNIKWEVNDFIDAHKSIKSSGCYNYQHCKIPIPTSIRYDRLREELGENISPRDERMLS